MIRQQQIDWDDAARKGAAKDRRILLTRIKQALAGRTLGDPSEPRSCVSGAVVAVVLDGLHGWCVSEGRTDRKPAEIGQPYSESRAKRALAYLQSPEAECCVAVEPFRSHGSPRNWRSICWSNLHAWCERLEADPVVRKSSQQTEPLVVTTGAERDGHRCGTPRSTGAERDGHRCGPHRSYKEDGPLDGPDGPPHGATGLLSETEADELEAITRGGDEKKFRSRVRGGVFLRVGRSAISRQASAKPESVDETSRGLGGTTASRRHGGEHDQHLTPGRTNVSTVPGAGLGKHLQEPGRASQPDLSNQPSTLPSVDRRSVSVAGHQPLRSEIESLLRNQLGVEGAKACVDIALQTQTIDQIAATVRYAASQAVGDVQAWGPGFVFQRVSQGPPSDDKRPEAGWAKKRPEWILAKGRQAARERQEREERRQNAERQLRQRRGEMEAFYGPVIDRLYREDKSHLWSLLKPAEQLLVQACGGSFTSRGARDIFLLAAIEGRFEVCE